MHACMSCWFRWGTICTRRTRLFPAYTSALLSVFYGYVAIPPRPLDTQGGHRMKPDHKNNTHTPTQRFGRLDRCDDSTHGYTHTAAIFAIE